MSKFRVDFTQGGKRTGAGALDEVAQRNGAVTGATNASPIVITSTAHGLTSGQKVQVSDVAGNTAANGVFKVVVVTADTFQLVGSTGDGSYTSGGVWEAKSVNKSTQVPGPNGTLRLLKDGDEFTDCNYWKKFSVDGGMDRDYAFITVIEDDGLTWDPANPGNQPKSYSLTAASDSDYEDNVCDILGDFSTYADFAQIYVTGDSVTCRINGDDDAVFTIAEDTVQSFNKNDFQITKLEFANDASGGTAATVNVLVGLAIKCKS